MPINYQPISVRASLGEDQQGEPPLGLKNLALQLEAAAPQFLFWSEGTDPAAVHVLLTQAAMTKIGSVPSSQYTFDPSAGTRFMTDHVINPSNPNAWDPIEGSYGIVYPVVATGGVVYYLGFSAAT